MCRLVLPRSGRVALELTPDTLPAAATPSQGIGTGAMATKATRAAATIEAGSPTMPRQLAEWELEHLRRDRWSENACLSLLYGQAEGTPTLAGDRQWADALRFGAARIEEAIIAGELTVDDMSLRALEPAIRAREKADPI